MICASCLSPASLVCVTSEYLLPYPILTWQLLQDSGSEDEGEDGDAEDGSYDQSNGEGEGVGVSDLFDALSEISMNTEEFLEKEEGDFIHTTYLPFPSILYLPFSTFPSLPFSSHSSLLYQSLRQISQVDLFPFGTSHTASHHLRKHLI